MTKEQGDEGKHFHLLLTAFLGKTADHIRDVHGREPHGDLPRPSDPDDRRANAAAHLEAHDVPVDARWSYRHRRFLRPKASR